MKTIFTLLALFFCVYVMAQTPPCRTPYLDLSTGWNHETNQPLFFNDVDPFWQISNGPALYSPYPHCAVSTGASQSAFFGNSRAITLQNIPLSGNMIPGVNACNYMDQPYLFEREIELYTGPNDSAMEVHLIVDFVTANYTLSSMVLSGPGGPYLIFPGCIENQTVSLSNTTFMLHSGHYTLQVHVGNEWDVNDNPTSMLFQIKGAIYSSSAIFSDNQHYGKHSVCTTPYLLPQTPVLVNDCFVPPNSQTEVIIDNYQPGMSYTITPGVTLNSSSFMANANTSYTVVVQDTYGCSVSTTTTVTSCEMDHVMMKVWIEGLYEMGGEMKPLQYLLGMSLNPTDVDLITLKLHEPTTPYTLLLSTSAMLQKDGSVLFYFPSMSSGLYYVEICYKNTLAVWTSTPVTLCNNAFLDLTQNATSVMGSVEKEMEFNNYALVSGDIDQNHVIDWFDSLLLITDIESGSSGYYSTDLNGDGVVDAFDYLLLFQNMSEGMSSATSP